MPCKDGMLVVISGPAGGGKTTLVQSLIRNDDEGCIRRAMTATTRQPRPGEADGIDYYFLTRDEFQGMIEAGEFFEYTEFNGNYYGTPRRLLTENLAKGGVVVLIIEVDGAESIKFFFPNAIFIFIIPPTPDELRSRLIERGTESDADVANRLSIARREMQRIDEYDFLVINDDLHTATLDLAAIIRISERAMIFGGELELWEAGGFKDWVARSGK